MALGSKFQKFDGILLGVIRVITAILLMIMFIVIIVEVIFRYVLESPPFWTEELARYVMFYMVLVGSVVAIREERHPALAFIIKKFGIGFRRKWNILIEGLVFFVLVIVFIKGFVMAVEERIGMTTALRVSFFWVYLALPIGAFLMMVEVVAKHILGRKAFNKNGESVSVSEEG